MILSMITCLFVGCSHEIPKEGLSETLNPSTFEVTETTTTPLPVSLIQKVALITDCDSIDDHAYNQACWQGVENWCSANSIDYTYYQPIEDSNDARVIAVDQAVQEGANVIVMSGYLFGATLIERQDKYPDVYFIAVDVGAGDMTYDYVDYYEPSPNVVCLTFAEEQAGYLAGYAAVKEGYTKLGFSGAIAVPAVIRYGYGFVQGADAAAAEMGVDIHLQYSYGMTCICDKENFNAKIKGWHQNGTELIFISYWDYIYDLFEIEGLKVISADVDRSHLSAKVLTSAIKELQNAVETTLSHLQEGNWAENYGGKFKHLSLADGDFVGIPTAPDSWKMNRFTIEEYEAVKNDIRTGIRTVSSDIETFPTVSDHTVIDEIG